MSYVLQLTDDPHFKLDQSLIRSLHYDARARCQQESGSVPPQLGFVVDEGRDEVVYEAPDFQHVPSLCEELVYENGGDDVSTPSYVRERWRTST